MPRTFKAGCTPLSRGKPRSGGVFLQDTAQDLWSTGALEPRKGEDLSGGPTG